MPQCKVGSVCLRNILLEESVLLAFEALSLAVPIHPASICSVVGRSQVASRLAGVVEHRHRYTHHLLSEHIYTLVVCRLNGCATHAMLTHSRTSNGKKKKKRQWGGHSGGDDRGGAHQI